MDDAAHGPASIAALREAVRNGREPPSARIVAGFKSYRWFVVGTVCVGAFMGQVDSSIAQMLLPRLELEFGARLSTVSWVAVAYLLAMAAFAKASISSRRENSAAADSRQSMPELAQRKD